MIWTRPDTPGHAGTLLGLVHDPDPAHRRYGDEGYRELSPVRDGPVPFTLRYGRALDVVQIGCSCGWRSERLLPPTEAEASWWGEVRARLWFLDRCERYWGAHAKGTVFGAQEAAAKVRAGP